MTRRYDVFLYVVLLSLVFSSLVEAQVREVHIKAVGGLQFDVVRFTAEPGENIRIVLTNADDMFHNMLFTQPGERESVVKAAFELAEHIAKSTGLLGELYADKSPEGLSRFENIQELLNGIKEFTEGGANAEEDEKPTLGEFLVDVALLTDADQDDDDDDKVQLMTIHASKGLEFPRIYIVGMEENLFPSQMALSERSELEEERRLFYVALTRAEQKATLTYATSRYRYGSLNYCEPSRFIEELDPRFVDLPSEPAGAARRGMSEDFDPKPWSGLGSDRRAYSSGRGVAPAEKKPQNGVPTNLKRLDETRAGTGEILAPGSVTAGTKVEHDKFGKGKVLSVTGTAPNEKATVFFAAVGQKQILLKFAKLKVLD